jgi:hypothetical protein
MSRTPDEIRKLAKEAVDGESIKKENSMEGELWGLGKTWWMAILLIVVASVMLFTGKFDPDQWKNMVEWIFALAAGKSAAVGVAKNITINPKKDGE